MYHSPGLRDGVSCQGTCVRPCPPEVLGAESILTRFTIAGNKFGRPQVPKVQLDLCAKNVRTGFSRKRREGFLMFVARTCFVSD
jgi:hypothetical protein